MKVEGPTPVLFEDADGHCFPHVAGGVPVVLEATGKFDLVLLVEVLLPTLAVELAVCLRQIAGGRRAKESASPHFIKAGKTSSAQIEIRCCLVDRIRPPGLEEEKGGGDVVTHMVISQARSSRERVSPAEDTGAAEEKSSGTATRADGSHSPEATRRA